LIPGPFGNAPELGEASTKSSAIPDTAKQSFNGFDDDVTHALKG
jgi:hypothetical protein